MILHDLRQLRANILINRSSSFCKIWRETDKHHLIFGSVAYVDPRTLGYFIFPFISTCLSVRNRIRVPYSFAQAQVRTDFYKTSVSRLYKNRKNLVELKTSDSAKLGLNKLRGLKIRRNRSVICKVS